MISESAEEIGFLEKFFSTYWCDGVNKARYVIIMIFTIWVVFASFKAFQIGPLTEAEKFVDDDHPIMLPFMTINNQFPANVESYKKVHYYFGVKDIDRTGESMWDAVFIGEPIMDNQFDMSSVESQTYLQSFCQDLSSADFIVEGSADCWYTDFVKFARAQGASFPVKDK